MSLKFQPIQLLLVEDNPSDARFVKEILKEKGRDKFTVQDVNLMSEALKILSDNEFDVILLDLNLPDSRGLDALLRISEKQFDVPVIVLTGMDDESLGPTAIQMGAQDYLTKGELSPDLLVRSIWYAIERHHLRKQQERELGTIESLSLSAPQTTPSSEKNRISLQEKSPAVIEEMTKRFRSLLSLAAGKTEAYAEEKISDEIREIGLTLATNDAGTHDIIGVYIRAQNEELENKSTEERAQVMELARQMAFELMGYVLSTYRNRLRTLKKS